MAESLKPIVSPLQLRDELETIVLKEPLSYGFLDAKQDVRLTISEPAKQEASLLDGEDDE